MMAATGTPGTYIEPPAYFPVSWEDPDDARLTWRPDGHVTAPMAPLSYSIAEAVLRGFEHAFAKLGFPIQMRIANFNGYLYVSVVPGAAPPMVQKAVGVANRLAPGLVNWQLKRTAAEMSKKQSEAIEPILARFDAYWQDDLLPQNRNHLAFFERVEPSKLSLPRLRAHLAAGLQRVGRLGKLHALATFPAIAAMSLFEELCAELFPDTTALDALRMLQGSDNQTVAGDRALWRLSRLVLAMPAVKEILESREPEAVVPALEQTVEGRRFLADFRAYLKHYGRRLNTFAGLSEPSWLEDPLTAISCLQTYLSQPESNPEAVQARLAEERDESVAEARRRLADRPQAVVARFETLLTAAQKAAGVKEDNHWIMQETFYQIRRLALGLGQRLNEAGDLPTVEDVFYLSAEELLRESVPDNSCLKERKAARARFAHVKPPPMLGTAPAFRPDGGGLFLRAMRKADGGGGRPDHGTSQIVRGRAASGGIVRGRARVITSLAKADRLSPGDVLVTRNTTPPWTPLFAIAAAVVTDTGGVLSHCAVVAREYGIPAVVGTGKATQTFRDGQLLEVNGTEGKVEVVESQESERIETRSRT